MAQTKFQQTMESNFLTADEMFILTFAAMTEIDRVPTDDDFEQINVCLN